MICWMNCLLSIDGIDDLATAGAFGPHARFPASRFIVDDCVPTRDCLAAERAVATDSLWVIRSHSYEFTGYFEGERERVTLFGS
jgi:hypothetical protein